jgi:site-specific recombinase XerD
LPLWGRVPGDADDFLSHIRRVQNLVHNTVRAYQTDVKLFLDFAGDGSYDWTVRCSQLFGTAFSQFLSEVTGVTHGQETAEASKRPFSVQELQEFFDLQAWLEDALGHVHPCSIAER